MKIIFGITKWLVSLSAAFFMVATISAYVSNANAGSTIQIQCGGLNGFAYHAEENLVPNGKGGWGKDKITDGETIIDLDIGKGGVSYRFKDATGKWKTPEDNGGLLHFLDVDEADGSFRFLIMYGGQALELITISQIQIKRPKMMYMKSVNGPAFTKSSLMTADCKIL